MIVFDASILIAHLDEHDALHAQAVERLLAADEPFGARTLTMAEVLVGPGRRGRLDDARAAVAALEVQEVPLGMGSAGDLATLGAETGLSCPTAASSWRPDRRAPAACSPSTSGWPRRAASLGGGSCKPRPVASLGA